LDYAAFGELAEREGARILEEARAKFDVLAIACVHRVGALKIGDLAVWVGVVAAHRGAAFDACRYVIDEAKARVPIWKKEHYTDGASEWVICATRAEMP
ncbi:MAG TPA: molybdenum cofactor biosynthesis protein MoaE, partial [Opitutus sp.]|nr:molybdenum cofactor biosynthesis protein MoaE [Opitutus sp.]